MLTRLRKLRRMSVAEIRSRCYDSVVQRRERRAWRQGKTTFLPAIETVSLLSNAVSLVQGASRSERRRLEEEYPEFAASLICRAEGRAAEINSGGVRLFDFRYDLQSPIDWHKDPRSDYRWPLKFYSDLPLYKLAEGVDVKYVWELGRHQFLAELARGWWATENEAYARTARNILIDWIHSNPIYEGVHWTSGLEVAMRSISWIWVLAFLSDWKGWKSEDLEAIGISLTEHAWYLRSHFSFYSSPFNHLIGEASALFLLSQLLSGFSDATVWESESLAVLEEHGPRQFYDDGFCVEQATGYHFYTLAFLSMALSAARTKQISLSNVEKSVPVAYLAGNAFRQPDGRWPSIGDLDSARSIPVLHDDFWRFDSLCSFGAVLFSEPRLKRGVNAGQEVFEILGTDGVDRWNNLAFGLQTRTAYLPSSGYFVASRDKDWLLLDVGPVAGGLHADSTPSAAHGHADTLQLLYMHDGQPVLIDPGMPFYGGATEWVDHFRSANAHNTVLVEGVGPVKPAGRLAWSHAELPPRFRMLEVHQFAQGTAEVSWGSVQIRRHVLFSPNSGLYIADEILADRRRPVTWNWHFPKIVAGFEEGEWHSGEAVVRCAALNSRRFQSVVQIGEGRNPVGWVAANYGILETAARLCISMDADPNTVLLTSIIHQPASVRFVTKAGAVGCGSGSASLDFYRLPIDEHTWWEFSGAKP